MQEERRGKGQKLASVKRTGSLKTLLGCKGLLMYDKKALAFGFIFRKILFSLAALFLEKKEAIRYRLFGSWALMVFPLLLGANCEVYVPSVNGTAGLDGKVLFAVEGIDDAFTRVFATGSLLDVVYVSAGASTLDRVRGASLRSGDENIFVLDEQGSGKAVLRILNAGEAALEVVDFEGEVIDTIALRSRENYSYQLLDAQLLGASVDARLPNSFAIIEDSKVSFVPSSLDGCGQPLLAYNGFQMSLEPSFSVAPDVELVSHEVQSGILHTFSVQEPGEFILRVFSGEQEVFRADVEVIERRDVDDIILNIAASDKTQAEVWGQIYGNGWEVIGESLNWSATPRVTLTSAQGPNTVASISVPAQGEPVDERPAVITASAFGEEGTLDLFASTVANVVTSRVSADTTAYQKLTSGGCDGDSSGFQSCSMGLVFLGLSRFSRRQRRLHARK